MGLTFNPAIKSRRMGMCHKKKIPKNIYESDGFVVEKGEKVVRRKMLGCIGVRKDRMSQLTMLGGNLEAIQND